jgi:hypothetical protein
MILRSKVVGGQMLVNLPTISFEGEFDEELGCLGDAGVAGIAGFSDEEQAVFNGTVEMLDEIKTLRPRIGMTCDHVKRLMDARYRRMECFLTTLDV